MAKVAISRCRNPEYPSPKNYSPDTAFPEYPFSPTFLSGTNKMYRLVRRCLYEFGADSVNYGTAQWNPLGQWIEPGDCVFILPNFVMHRRPSKSLEEFYAKCTHSSVIRALLDYAVIATGDPSLVSFGNAPIQACNYNVVAQETGAESITEFYQQVGNPNIGPHDLRLLITRWTRFGALIDKKVGDPSQAVMVDVGKDSLLDELFRQENAYPLVCVGDYPPEETIFYHGVGKHIYAINRRILEADAIISVPKLKTHQKVGITCALKGTVGTIARKECLAHHRRGGPENGGDEYPRATLLRDMASSLADKAASGGTDVLSNMSRVVSKVLYRVLRTGPDGIMGGAWFGNDTAWRMTLDIARILRYARPDGTMSDIPQRQHLTLVDGIIAGEGEGPLTPRPRKTEVVLFSPDICAGDAACALVMGYDPRKIPLLKNSFLDMPFSLTDNTLGDLCLILNGQQRSALDILLHFRPSFLTPKGWRGALEAHDMTGFPNRFVGNSRVTASD